MMPFQRGFFCEDLSIRYPYHDPTLSIAMLAVVMLLFPVLLIFIAELLRVLRPTFRWRDYVWHLWRSLLVFGAGFLATYLTSDLAKTVIGRLRPHFYDACRPILMDGTTCENGTMPAHTYIQDYYCSNPNLTAYEIDEIRYSFPSSHSSLSFYSVIFMGFYLHARWQGRGWSRALQHTVQFLILMIACYFALSRIADYWHHWSDVLAGVSLGAGYAALTALYVGRLLRRIAPAHDLPRTVPQKETKEHLMPPSSQPQQPSECDWKLQAV